MRLWIRCLMVCALIGCGDFSSETNDVEYGGGLAFPANANNASFDLASLVNIYPTDVTASRGTVSSDQPISALQTIDLVGEQDDWMKYKDLTPAGGMFLGQFTFNAPSTVSEQGQLKLRINYRGWAKNAQRWRFQIYDTSARRWVYVGDNGTAKDWIWSMLELPVPGVSKSYINAEGVIRVRVLSLQARENAFFDFVCLEATASSTTPVPPPPPPATSPYIWGVTVDSTANTAAIVESLRLLAKRPTTRIVFDEEVAAQTYLLPAQQIRTVSHIMGEILDSYYVKSYSVDRYQRRVSEYLDVLGDHVDIWEVGNETNGEWLGSTSDVVKKVSNAYAQVRARGKKAALTLYYNEDCWANPAHEVFRWTRTNIPADMKEGLDYVFLSYYEDDCNDLQPKWPEVFKQLGSIFPSAKIGFGEVGTRFADRKKAYIERYYGLRLDHPRFVGGYFWWYFRQDMVPHTQTYWNTLNQAIKLGP